MYCIVWVVFKQLDMYSTILIYLCLCHLYSPHACPLPLAPAPGHLWPPHIDILDPLLVCHCAPPLAFLTSAPRTPPPYPRSGICVLPPPCCCLISLLYLT